MPLPCPSATTPPSLEHETLAPPGPRHMARWRPAMLLVLAVALVAAAGWRADALSVTVTDTTECIHEFVPYEGDSVTGNFVVVDHDIFWSSDHPGIDLMVTSPGGNTVYTLKGKSGEKFEFKAPRGGMYKFCFHNPYGASETVSFYIHVGHVPNEHNLAKDEHLDPTNVKIAELKEALESVTAEQMYLKAREARHRHSSNLVVEEEAMKKRFEEWMAEYHRTYKDEEEKVQRYELFKDCAKIVDKLNALPDRVTYKTNDFCDRSSEEMRCYTGG
ncbi:transmembrane emp24 domain-containing protein p24beta3-like [Phragmites australis]|uniref:transmembrane emp24 domain-containing protein p24beta3-like n=1 Tax=Phragmites australis TaxID=29695 RepID=UPI002D796CEC|nr:transmembrane emp24 domain-containing protein p24beta3-like [Phragmites australis]